MCPKLLQNLCLHKWLNPQLNLVSNFVPCRSVLMEFSRALQKPLQEVTMTLDKKESWKNFFLHEKEVNVFGCLALVLIRGIRQQIYWRNLLSCLIQSPWCKSFKCSFWYNFSLFAPVITNAGLCWTDSILLQWDSFNDWSKITSL